MATYALEKNFGRSLDKLAPRDQRRVKDALEKYGQNIEMSGRKLEKLKGNAGKNGLHTFRASDELRVLLRREGSISVLLRAGHHDEIYRFAQDWRFVAPHDGVPGLIATKPDAVDLGDSPQASRYTAGQRVPDNEPSVLEHWDTPNLAKVGFDGDEIRRLRRATQNSLFDVWPDMTDEKVDLVVECMEQSPDEFFQRQLISNEEVEAKRFRNAIVERGALGGLSSLLTQEEFRRLMSAPIEDWMIFLHPDQLSLVDRRFTGPARVRGAAGTGKTVVALHRAAALAKRYKDDLGHVEKPILFTTFIKSLPPVFENLYRRLPNAVEGAVEFIHINSLAYRLCRKVGEPSWVDESAVKKAFDRAFAAVIRNSTPLRRAGLTEDYLRDEVQDVVRKARDWALLQPEPMYRAALIDESQDLSLVGLQLIRALVSGVDGQDRPDALFIVGDGAQKIYPGGFTLAQAGINVRGNRSKVLSVNYRNTREIMDAAMACAGSEPVDDLGDEYARGDADIESVRRGTVKPCFVRALKWRDQVDYVVKKIKELRESRDVGFGDIGVFAATNSKVATIIDKFERTELYAQFQKLKDIEGRPNDFIKVGTFHRAKGLEFKVVFLFGISEKSFPTPHRLGETIEEYNERKALEISQLFVAMTRARDQLFLLSDDNPSEVLYEALDYFEEEEA